MQFLLQTRDIRWKSPLSNTIIYVAEIEYSQGLYVATYFMQAEKQTWSNPKFCVNFCSFYDTVVHKISLRDIFE